ncbi:MAG TPA: hypothetical protein PLJ71_20050 [Candidatus Hydrogenedentes bacterium]|nr:hypothetical protein [Candidatus Hydrogenedentota bacterium]HQM50985.1 hypothetical protein [Candidatus Hydrogenedentota bacterium]
MRKLAIVCLGVVVAAALLTSVSSVLAAKPMDVIARSNGFPSGAHFNLNIHGKKDGFVADPTAIGGCSVFISEYGQSTISYVSNKRSSVTELIALDPYAEAFDGDPALVQLPSDPQGYYVFARIVAKPGNGSTDGEPSSIILVPDPVLQACNDDPLNPDPNFGSYTDCDDALWALGLVTTQGVYEATEAEFVRFASDTTTGKGRSMGTDITGLFLWSGWVCDASLDVSGPEGVPDGVINQYDVPIEYDLIANGGNGNGFIDQAEMDAWLADAAEAGLAVYYENEWVFNIADLVIQDQSLQNDGTKLLQIRFYPVSTTEFVR